MIAMTDRSIPINLAGTDYELQFEAPDVEACENEMMIGYIFFFRTEGRVPVYLSLRLCKSLIHHGLRTADTRGDLHYVLPQTPTGALQAADLIKKAMQQDRNALLKIWEKAYEAFELDWFPKPTEGTPSPEKKEPASKNSHGTGSNQRNRTRTGS